MSPASPIPQIRTDTPEKRGPGNIRIEHLLDDGFVKAG
jgi:hypothetical protein